jgi:transglutaminase-like putative cysteine protease
MIFTPEGFPKPTPAYLEPTEFLDFDHPLVARFVQEAIGAETDARERAIRLFYAVRDKIRYDPFNIRLERETYRASTVLKESHAFCIPKAVLLAAAARAAGIPSAIGLADVRNHLTSEKLQKRMGDCDLFIHHGYAVLYIEGQWLKAVPAFNIDLCTRFGVVPTEFDGKSDAIMQEFDAQQRKHMEYVRYHGIWSDLPFNRIAEDFAGYYPSSLYSEPLADDFE